MKAILVNDDRSLRWDNVPDPIINDEEVLVKIEAAIRKFASVHSHLLRHYKAYLFARPIFRRTVKYTLKRSAKGRYVIIAVIIVGLKASESV